jgi:hypothetical protein
MNHDDPQTAPQRRRSLGGRRALLGLLLLAAVSTLWYRSYHHCDALAIFGPGGRIGGIVFQRGEIWTVFSNIQTAQPWTAQTLSTSLDEGEELRQLLITNGTPKAAAPTGVPPDVARRWKFFIASHHANAFGLPGAWCSTAGGPAWTLLPLGAWPVIGWMRRRARLWRRKRRGWCLACGYDLRGAHDRCPECGQTPPPPRSAKHPPGSLTRQLNAGA